LISLALAFGSQFSWLWSIMLQTTNSLLDRVSIAWRI